MIKHFLIYSLVMAFVACSTSGEYADSVYDSADYTEVSVEREDAELIFTTIDRGYRNPVAIDYVGTDDVLFIVEQGRNRFLRLTSDGIRMDSVGSRGSGDQRFDAPTSVNATNGLQIFIADRNNARVQLFERRLSYVSTILPPSGRRGINPVFFRPEAVTVNAFGDLFVYDSESESILKYDQNARFQLSIPLAMFDMELPLAAIASHEDSLYLLEKDRGLFHEITAQGGYRGFSAGVEGIRAIYVRSSTVWGVTANEILIFSLSGRLLNRFTHNVSADLRGMAVSRSSVYLLTAHDLRKIDRPQVN